MRCRIAVWNLLVTDAQISRALYGFGGMNVKDAKEIAVKIAKKEEVSFDVQSSDFDDLSKELTRMGAALVSLEPPCPCPPKSKKTPSLTTPKKSKKSSSPGLKKKS